MVPLVHHLEIPGAGAERRASAPAVHLQQIGGRGKHIRHRMAQIDATVSVEIYSVFDVGGWQELGLPDLACIGVDEVAGKSPRARMCNAAMSSLWNSSLRRQSCTAPARAAQCGGDFNSFPPWRATHKLAAARPRRRLCRRDRADPVPAVLLHQIRSRFRRRRPRRSAPFREAPSRSSG